MAITWAVEPAIAGLCCLYTLFVAPPAMLIVAMLVFANALTEMGGKRRQLAPEAEPQPRRRWWAEIDATIAFASICLLGWLVAQRMSR